MAAASSSCQGSYDVFLNFRGKDTRNGFTAHLYEALCNKEIRTFMDADKIVKGEEISASLVTAMDKSMFCIVVLSKNYASSTWCLDELVQILKCKNAKKQTVLPIFYNVNPSDVREQKGSFAKAFAKLEEKYKEKMERVHIWKQALTEVANISGWDARNRHEPMLTKEIIQYISNALINRSSKDVEAIVRVDSHLQVKERIPVLNIPTVPSIGERSEIPVTSKRKINRVRETDIRGSRDAIEVYSLEIMDSDISTSLTVGQRSEVPLTSKRKIEEMKETKITHTSHLSFLNLLSSPVGLHHSKLPSSSPPFISPPTSPTTSHWPSLLEYSMLLSTPPSSPPSSLPSSPVNPWIHWP
ncbi:TMV resistance protein N-like isoform X1 [Vitis riparia]|uniref:TMV resistance protein N-like isoform X1 n=2 Tax=Vitis riparia TaxID=96939 RepID=UPI00155B1594|nr:TMV resistance protein N-like isoform X1 [Vitis riparia]